MKTVLIATHQISFSEPESLHNCLGVLTLSAGLKERSLECEILDLFEYNNLYNRNSDEVLDAIVQKILTSKPDLLGFSAMINNLPIALELAARIKQIRPKIMIIFGGPGTAFCAKDVLLNFSQVDFIFRGEVDFIFPDFVESLQNGRLDYSLPGLIFRDDADIRDNGWPAPIRNLDNLPLPDYQFSRHSDLNSTSELFGDYNGVSIETGRGCPFTCNFCSTSVYFKRKYRLKSTDRVIKEILLVQARHGRARIIFNHDLFTLNRNYVLEICEQLKTRVPGIVWKCHARLDTLDEEILQKMYEAGCNEIFVGLESATEKMQRFIHKKLDLYKFPLLIEMAESLNMKFSFSFIVGFPEEDENDVKEIFAYCLKAKYRCREKVQIKIHSLAPLVGSPLYEEWKGRLVYDDYGSIGTSDIPYEWSSLRENVKKHPEIFSLYFHLPVGEKKRLDCSKFGYLGLVIEKLMVNSIWLAYKFLGDNLAEVFIKNIDRIMLPPPASLKNSEYNIFAESVRMVIYEALNNGSESQKMYDALARYEIAILESQRADGNFCKIIEAFYHPEEILEQLKINTGNLCSTGSGQNRYFMIFRDQTENKMKSAEISREFYSLATG